MRLSRSSIGVLVIAWGCYIHDSSGFSCSWGLARPTTTAIGMTTNNFDTSTVSSADDATRRSFFTQATLAASAAISCFLQPDRVNAAVGSLPEFSNTNAILQGVTVNVADQSQQDAMIAFLRDAFDFQALRQRKEGSITETWLGYGPEQLSIPSDFTLPVSSFASYGGHASICVRYDTQSASVFYRTGDGPPGDNIAFLQVGVPTYRISQMVKNGANVQDAYGYVTVVSPCGLPMRGIVGISPDPIMFVALNCEDVEQSRVFYQQLGFVEQEYPFARPSKGTGQFEPPQPTKSVYMAPSPNCMGVLLLPTKGTKKKKGIIPNPVLQSLNLVYTPSPGAESSEEDIVVVDPSGVAISLQPVEKFEVAERSTRL